ncbi:MAG: polysulfide reductase NrfD [Planctomycetes bacterium]|nr:polysulfide reductase NrfD [Planctomycetota bacterium]
MSDASEPRDVPESELHVGSPLVLEPGHTYASVTDKISSIVLNRRLPRGWLFGFSVSFILMMLLLYGTCHLFATGVGIWGTTIPIGWAFPIINFVWWVGIGHAGTLISAVLLLLHQDWRTSINRFAEAMTLFAVSCAGLFPLLHLGRPWVFHWLLPYPNTMDMWPNFRSPLVWDVFAVLTYLTVSTIFWYVGLIPDLATMRDRAQHRVARIVYGMPSLGWRGSAAHWRRYQTAYLLLAGLATPLVVSVHSIVGMDFANSLVPGWHTTIFPPYFVAGAIFSGFAMVMTLAIPLRKFYGLEDFVTLKHLDNMAKVMLATGSILAYGYAAEVFFSYYSGNPYERYVTINRALGPYGWSYGLLVLCNIIVPQLFWFRPARRSVPVLFMVSIVINVGMWLERFVIVVVSLHRDYLPSAWRMYYPTAWDYAFFVGSLGLFFTLLFLFIRVLPMISIFELRELVHETEGEG